MVQSLSLLSCEVSVSAKENTNRKNILRERVVIVVRIEDMLIYSRTLYYVMLSTDILIPKL